MKRPLYSRPDAFSISPFFSLLPVLGNVGKLEALSSSLFARYERVHERRDDMEESDDNRELLRRISAEEGMLRQVLDWLAIKPDKSR